VEAKGFGRKVRRWMVGEARRWEVRRRGRRALGVAMVGRGIGGNRLPSPRYHILRRIEQAMAISRSSIIFRAKGLRLDEIMPGTAAGHTLLGLVLLTYR
jgi:hypothetical protein